MNCPTLMSPQALIMRTRHCDGVDVRFTARSLKKQRTILIILSIDNALATRAYHEHSSFVVCRDPSPRASDDGGPDPTIRPAGVHSNGAHPPFAETAQTWTIKPDSVEEGLHDSTGRKTDLQIARRRPSDREVAARVRDERNWSFKQWDELCPALWLTRGLTRAEDREGPV